MSWARARIFARFAAAAVMAAALAGCFRPLYAERSDGQPAVRDRLLGVEVPQLNLPNGSREARVGQEIRNALMFSLYGAATGVDPSTHEVLMKIRVTRLSVIVDPSTTRPDIENYGIDADYALRDKATKQIVFTAVASSRVSYDIPGQEQRFARQRAFRDAENRAAKVIAEQMNERLASYFAAGI